MEDSGFKVYKNFKTSQKVIDIYAILPTTIGDFGVVVACKNYDKDFEIGVDVLKEMEEVGESLKASKVTVVSSSYFSSQATNYALRKNIKLVDRNNLIELAKKYQDNTSQTTLDNTPYDGGASAYIEEEYTYDESDIEYLMQRRDRNPNVYKSSLYKQIDEDRHRGFDISSLLNKGKSIKRITGLIEMVVALLLSYGLSLYTERSSNFIIKGTFVFFISLVILIILIFV